MVIPPFIFIFIFSYGLWFKLYLAIGLKILMSEKAVRDLIQNSLADTSTFASSDVLVEAFKNSYPVNWASVGLISKCVHKYFF